MVDSSQNRVIQEGAGERKSQISWQADSQTLGHLGH